MLKIARSRGLTCCALSASNNRRPCNKRSADSTRSLIIAAFTATCVALTGPAIAQDPPEKVVVGNATYVVTGASVAGATGTEPLDAATVNKARFTARVLDQQILHSDFNKQIFNPTYRAVVFADESSRRLVEPWRKKLRGSSADALAKAKTAFRTWVTKLGVDPNALMLAVARRDYLDGIGAYRDSLAIFRNITQQKQALTYDDALALMRNVWPTIRLAYARASKSS